MVPAIFGNVQAIIFTYGLGAFPDSGNALAEADFTFQIFGWG